jgi:hypothetical protein
VLVRAGFGRHPKYGNALYESNDKILLIRVRNETVRRGLGRFFMDRRLNTAERVGRK